MAKSSADPNTSEFAPHSTAPVLDMPTGGLPEKPTVSEVELRQHADALARQWETLPRGSKQVGLSPRLDSLKVRLTDLLRKCRAIASTQELTPQLELLESTRMLESAITAGESAGAPLATLPHVRLDPDGELPRTVNLAEAYLSAARGIWSPESLTTYVLQVQLHDALLFEEILVLPQALKLAQMEYIFDRADEAFTAGDLPPIEQSPFSAILHSLRRLGQNEWRNVLEPLVAFDAILREDPCNVFAKMEEETRSAYRLRIAELAATRIPAKWRWPRWRSILRARPARQPRLIRRTRRIAHIGYYLFAEGFPLLRQRIGYHAPLMERVRLFLRRWNEDFYILGVFMLSLLLIVAIVAPLVPHYAFWPVMGALLLALLPATQGGVDLVNHSVTALLKTDALPKLDFSKGVPDDATASSSCPRCCSMRNRFTNSLTSWRHDTSPTRIRISTLAF